MQDPTNKRNHPSRGWKLFFIVVLVLLVLSILGNVTNPQANNTGTPGSVVNPIPAASVEPADKTVPKTWQKVVELSGNTNKRSDVFKLEGGKQRITWTVQGDMYPRVAVYVMEADKELMKDGGFAEVSSAMPGETLSYKSAGEYYIEAMSANANWTVVVEEMR